MQSTLGQIARARETRFFRALAVLQGKVLLASDAARVLSRTRLPIRIAWDSDLSQVVLVGKRRSDALSDVLDVGGEVLLRLAASAGGASVVRYQQ